MKKLLFVTICSALICTSVYANDNGNNSRIQGLEADVAELQRQIADLKGTESSDPRELMYELCNLYELTGNTLPLFCRNCGNGKIELFEDCDDGNIAAGDGCSSDCLFEECGNGRVDFGEECDDGNVTDGDACSSICAVEYKRVFLTAETYNGNLDGVAGADSKCNASAAAAGLSGIYQAWVSDSYNSAANRFTTHYNGNYALVDGTPVADDWNDLTDAYLINPINKDAAGNPVAGEAWTNTLYNGNLRTTNTYYNCSNWTSSSSYGYFGTAEYITGVWTQGLYKSCQFFLKLYCFEQ